MKPTQPNNLIFGVRPLKRLFIVLCIFLMASQQSLAQTTLSSLADLKAELATSNGNFVMTPGTYSFNSSNCGPGKLFSDPQLLFFTGSNSTFDFTGVTFEFDTEIFTLYGNVDVVEFWPVGNNNVYKNLTMEDIGMNAPSKGAGAIHLDGADNRIEGFKTTVRGSFPYGYGDIFGKGGGSVIAHQKHAGILVRGDRNHVKNCTVIMRSYGHGIFMQGSQDALIEGCYVEGELRTVGEVLEEAGTGSPADNVNFLTVWGYYLTELQHDYRFSLQEDGIRCYTNGIPYGGTERSTTGTQIKNCTVVQMRSGVTIGWDYSNKVVENCTVLACETGFWFGGNTQGTGNKGDASLGPLFSEDVGRSNSTVELTILDNYVTKIGNTPHLFFAGDGHNLTLYDSTTYFDSDILLQVGGERVGHRWLAGSGEEPINRSATNVTFTNNTKYPVVLESNVSNSTVNSCGSVTNSGTGNTVTNLTNCSYVRPCNNTAENLQAECYDTMSGIQSESLGTNNEQNIGFVHDGDWISFSGIDISGTVAVEVVASSQTNGGNIEVRQGGITGTLLATIPVSGTGSWETYQTFSANLTGSGAVDVFFVFRGATGYLYNIDKLAFQTDPCYEASYNPFLPIGAEDFCEMSGIIVEDISVFNQNIGGVHDGDYIRFSNVDFGYDDVYNTIEVLASSANAGGNIEVRSGSVSGTLLATVTVPGTGSWTSYEVFSAYTSVNITGVHDIYLVFTGGAGSLLNLDNFYFFHDECKGIVYDPYLQVDALDYCEMLGVVPINNDYLGGIHHGDWIRYGSVDFTATAPIDVTLNLAGLSTTTGYVNIMLDDPVDGTQIATANAPQSGGWENWQQVTVPINQTLTGVHEVYLYFGNSEFNIDWFQFRNTAPAVNLALNKTASQSSTAYSGDASRAVDGNTNGIYSGNSVTHTNSEANPWWEVDLGSSHAIDEIVVFNRTDGCCVGRLSDFTVIIKDSLGNTSFSQSITTVPNPSVTINTGGMVGKTVRVQLNTTDALSLAEVEVYGASSANYAPTVNITAPTNGATMNNGDNVVIAADASDSDGTVSQVEFFVDGVSVGVDTSSPYSTNWTIGVGTYQLTAVATDNNGATSTSAMVSVTGNAVTGPPEAGKTYYIDNPYWDLRLGANGSEDAFTTTTSTTGAQVEWSITASPTAGYFYVDCNGGGSAPRIRTDQTQYADMQSASSGGTWTRWVFTDAGNGTYYMTTLKSSNYERLQMDNAGVMKMVPSTYAGTWEQFTFTEVTNPTARTVKAADQPIIETLSVYPNPVVDQVIISIPEPVYKQFTVFNLEGRIVKQGRVNEEIERLTIDMKGLQSGIYILNMSGEFQNETVKIIKK